MLEPVRAGLTGRVRHDACSNVGHWGEWGVTQLEIAEMRLLGSWLIESSSPMKIRAALLVRLGFVSDSMLAWFDFGDGTV